MAKDAQTRNKILSVSIKGFKTIREQTIAPGDLTVLIGANGAGKSNFINFFRLLTFAMQGKLGWYMGERAGGADCQLFDGHYKTPLFTADITLGDENRKNEYEFSLCWAAQNKLIYTEEKFRYTDKRYGDGEADWKILQPGVNESALYDFAERYSPETAAEIPAQRTAYIIRNMLRRIRIYQFHDTSWRSAIRSEVRKDESVFLKDEGSNLPAFLLNLRENNALYYKRIVEVTRQIIPFFDDYVLEPQGKFGMLLLRWKEKDSDMDFGPVVAADGMLRVMALIALLLQPPDMLPDVLIVDEPELGMHPYAISILGGLIKSASLHTQVIVATQSPQLVDCFEIDDILVVERKNRETNFKRLSPEKLNDWLENYSLSELWEKNVLGGQP